MSINFTLVTIENYHTIITGYITKNEIIISDYDDMTNTILKMIREGYCFNFDKNLLRGFLEDLTYMYSPNDEKNKDRIVNMLEESDEEEDSEDEEDSDQMSKMMQMLMGGAISKSQQSTEDKVSEDKVSEEPEAESE